MECDMPRIRNGREQWRSDPKPIIIGIVVVVLIVVVIAGLILLRTATTWPYAYLHN